jgi:DNA-binding transcriptional regulator YdaS (Cro superfamily)
MPNPIDELNRLIAADSQTAVAKTLGISPQYLSDVINQRRLPGKKILAALGLERVVTHRRATKSAAR